MEQNTTLERLHALDGIRGLAILLVFMNHLQLDYYYIPHLPGWISKIGNETLIGSGQMGVGLLFILSGFFMAYLYSNPKDKLKFIQKRYTRIFPLFISICIANFLILTYFPHILWVLLFGFILIFALFTHVIWVYIIKSIGKPMLSTKIFISFFVFQMIIALVCLYISVPQNYLPFSLILFLKNPYISNIGKGLINVSLTFPFISNFVPVNGVFWSLSAEVIFYIIYPFICAPLVNYFVKKNIPVKLSILLSLLPFFAILYYSTLKILGLGILQFNLFYYFVTGITLGYLYNKKRSSILDIGNFFKNKWVYYVPPLLVFLIFVFGHVIEDQFYAYKDAVMLVFALPFTFVIAIALNRESLLAKLFCTKFFVFLGTISYSIYLSHELIIYAVYSIFPHTRHILYVFFFVIITFFVTVLISSILYYLLERPYFMSKKKVL